MPNKPITIALAGNPNSGKSTIFNNLTGTRQKVGNWPGVTVEKKEGHLTANGYRLTVVDLPGTYSLTAYSIEEIVARNFILDEKPELVVNIIDASNLERNLYLATQLRELDTKVIFVLNMEDVARHRGSKIDGDKLAELLDVPVVF
ncbi:MAG: 50S ribosome-binding GTPase, partial [Deltaproteobacteria bacterium]|nr:50S ribosome-binding GTPase [Deltaproteobacteria bacterium]